MIEGFIYQKGVFGQFDISKLKSVNILKKNNTHLWVSVRNPSEQDIKLLVEKFRLHPTIIANILSPTTRIKYEEYDNNTFVIFKGMKEKRHSTVTFYSLFLVDGYGYIISIYHGELDTIDNLVANHNKIESLLKKGEDYVLHYILDQEVNKYVVLRASISDELRKMEEEFFKKPGKHFLKTIFAKEKVILEIKERIDSITDVCLMLKKPTDNFIENNLIPYFRDIYDHAHKVSQTLKTYLDRIHGMRNSYLSLTSNRMNETVRVLTIVMSLMMPMSIITGFFGMNIKLPLQDNAYAFEIIFLILIISALVMLLMFKWLGWIGKEENYYEY